MCLFLVKTKISVFNKNIYLHKNPRPTHNYTDTSPLILANLMKKNSEGNTISNLNIKKKTLRSENTIENLEKELNHFKIFNPK